MDKISVLMIDDHQLFLDAWTEILHKDGRFRVIDSTNNIARGFAAIETQHLQIVWIEVHLLAMDGLTIAAEVARLSPGSSLMVVSGYAHPAYVCKILQAGAKGYVTKNSSKEELIEGLLEVEKGNRFICKELKQVLADKLTSDIPVTLSRKELEVIHGIKQGFSSKEIAVGMNITTKTVQVHRYNILKKLELKNVAALINYIHTQGI